MTAPTTPPRPRTLRVLHVADPAAGDEPLLACRAAMQIAGAAHEAWIIGPQAAEDRAATHDIHTTDRLTAGRTPDALFGPARFRRLFHDRYLGADQSARSLPPPDVIHAWSVPALGLVRAAIGRRAVPRAACLLRTPTTYRYSRTQARRIGAALDDAALLCADPCILERFAPLASSFRGGLTMRENLRVVEPPLPPDGVAPPTPDRRAALRARLGLGPADLVIALLADPPAAADAMAFEFLLGLLHFAGLPSVGLLPSGVANLRRAARFVRAHGRAWGLIESGLTLADRLAAADMAVLDARTGGTAGTFALPAVESAGPLSITTAQAIGVPVVAASSPVARRALGPLAGRVLALDPTPRATARRIVELAENPALRGALAADGLELARARAHDDAHRRTLLALWREAANLPVLRPGLPRPASAPTEPLPAALLHRVPSIHELTRTAPYAREPLP